MNKYEKALDNVRKFEREHNMSKFGDVVPQPNSDTLEELVDKETPRKVLIKGTVIQCPKCFNIFPYVTGPLGPCVTSTEYCPDCGQHLDWSD